jgi:hypothetical protein
MSAKEQSLGSRDDWCRARRVASRRYLWLRLYRSLVAPGEAVGNVQPLQHHPQPRGHAPRLSRDARPDRQSPEPSVRLS